MTQRDFLQNVLNGILGDAEIQYAQNALTKLDAANQKRRENPPKAVVEKRAENEQIGAVLYEVLTDAPTIVADIQTALTEKGYELKPQRINSIAHTLVDAGKIEAVDVKVPTKGTQRGYKRITEEN